MLRAFVRALSNEVPKEYVFGLDMGLDERDAAIVQDELRDRGAAVGTPPELGGVAYDELGITGTGVAEAVSVACRFAGLSIECVSVSVQGFGAVGGAAALRLAELGATIVAVSTASGAICDSGGLDVRRLLELRSHFGESLVDHYDGKGRTGVGEELRVKCDVLVPAAVQDVIVEQIAGTLCAKIIVEGANLPTSPKAQEVLKERGVLVVPDIVANAGAVIATAFAMDMRYSALRPDLDEIMCMVKAKIANNTLSVIERARAENLTSHEVARRVASERVRRAMDLKGRLMPA